MKKNCWEFYNCGRQPGGEKVIELGVCPAATEERLNGVHGGNNSGRACWVVAGTMCNGEVQGTFARKYRDCAACYFYREVKEEENGKFVPTIILLDMVDKET